LSGNLALSFFVDGGAEFGLRLLDKPMAAVAPCRWADGSTKSLFGGY
jgi:hypothetical protein